VDYVTLGGGQTKHLKGLPPGVRLGTNAHAILGGFRLWNEPAHPHRQRRSHVAHSRRRSVEVEVAGEKEPAASPSA
jgi:hypothetical protein